jgi:hypothetical protein
LLSLFFAVNELRHSVLDATILPALLNNPTTTDLIRQGSWLEQALFAGAFGTMMMGMVLLMISVVLVGIGTLIEGSYPRWSAVLLLAAASTAILPLGHGPVGPALLYVSVAGFGFAMLTPAGREPLPVWLPLPRHTARQAPLHPEQNQSGRSKAEATSGGSSAKNACVSKAPSPMLPTKTSMSPAPAQRESVGSRTSRTVAARRFC